MPSGNNSGGWLADLFGGQDKTYSDKDGNDIRMSQSANDRAVNASRGGLTITLTIPLICILFLD